MTPIRRLPSKMKLGSRSRAFKGTVAPKTMELKEWIKLTSSKISFTALAKEEAKKQDSDKCKGCRKVIKRPAGVCDLCHMKVCRDCKHDKGVKAIEDQNAASIPECAFGKNDYEKKILIDYLEDHKWNLVHEFKKKLTEMEVRKWKYKNNLGKNVSLKRTDTVCKKCFETIWSDMLYRYRKSLQSSMASAIKKRPNCWYGITCSSQSKDLAHAKKYNHICEKQ